MPGEHGQSGKPSSTDSKVPTIQAMRNTKAFKEAVAQTVAELARRGVTMDPATVADAIEQNTLRTAEQARIQVRSVWTYFDPSVFADGLRRSLREP